ncbi:MAG: glycosyltransferase family 39 protein [Thermoleophilaceae bacterium]
MSSGAVRAVVGVGALMALSAYLRMRSFGSGYWIDEGLSWGIASHHFFSIPHVLRQDGSPPLYYMLLHIWMGLFGTNERTTHGLSLLFALPTIPVAFWAARSMFGERAGWFAAVLFALDSYLTTYAQETRMYSLMVLLTLLATAGFMQAFVFRRRRYLFLFGGATVLMLYTHNWGAFFVAASLIALAVLVARSQIADRGSLLRDAAFAYGGAFLLFIPWLPTLAFQAKHTGAPWATVPTLGTLMKATSSTLDGDRIAFLVLLGGGAGLARMIEHRRGVEREAAITGLVLFVGTLLIAWLWSQASPAWAYRYFAVFVAPLLLVAGIGLSYARRLGIVALAIVVVLWVPFTAIKHKSINRHVVRVVAPALKAGDLVVVTHPEQVPSIVYYMPAGMHYATELGPVKDTGVADWIDALSRLQAATPRKDLVPLLDQVKVGQHVLLMRPVIGPASAWKAPWTKLVRVRSAQWARAMSRDHQFKLVARYPRLKHGYAPRGMRALLYTKVAAR